ncbi:cytochrome oxidase maturation protein, cbb3-type [Paracoccus halophilus]|uniref:Cytochrome oxidase maturation protein, cbb3-type n=1 Tax=Paracoccus halophilus TaxID=376733 RepID=A0A1I0SNS9_9RHOB|nr:cytochrome oxidase maturation protein, cbb3-type [Paracoccus halophilus]
MSALILIPVSLVMGLVGLGAFFWALRHGQFDDPAGNSCRILIPKPNPATQEEKQDDRMVANADHENPGRRL